MSHKKEEKDQGTDFATCDQRSDLNGQMYTTFEGGPIYSILNGYKVHIPSPTMFGTVFTTTAKKTVWAGVKSVCTGAPLSHGACLVQAENVAKPGEGQGAVFLVTNGAKWGIPSPAVMNDYQFNWDNIFLVPQIVLDLLPGGPVIQPPTQGPQSDSTQ